MKAQDLLPEHVNQGEFNGTVVRKGTVGAFLINARVWLDTAVSASQRKEAEQDILDAVPALQALGLFDICAVRDVELQRLIASA